MNKEWKVFLDDNGAVFSDNIVLNFGNPQREQQASSNNSPSGTVMSDLSHLGVIRASGADAASFLQGQLTNDIKQVNDQHCQVSGYCNPQGRLLAIFQIFAYQGDYYLLLPTDLLHETLERLKKYIMISKVTLEDVSDDWVRFGVYGQQAKERLGALLKTLPDPSHTAANNTVTNDGAVCTLHIAGLHDRYLVFGVAKAMQTLWQNLDVHAAAVGASNWDWHDIQAGLPAIYTETMGNFIPQMVNLDILSGINFQKGCYTGQEIVARLHYRGKVKRRMYLAHMPLEDHQSQPQPGDILYHEQGDQDEGKAIGHIVRCQSAPEGGISILAVAIIELADNGLKNGEIHWQSSAGPSLESRALPYTLTDDKNED